MSLAMRPNELNTEINRLQGAMPSSLFYVKTVDADVSNLNEIKKNPIQSRTNPNKLSVGILRGILRGVSTREYDFRE